MRPILMASARAKPPLTFTQDGRNPDYTSAEWTITASEPVTWSWSSTGNVPGASVSSGGTAQSITFSINATGKIDVSSTIHCSAAGVNFDFTLTAWGSLHP